MMSRCKLRVRLFTSIFHVTLTTCGLSSTAGGASSGTSSETAFPSAARSTGISAWISFMEAITLAGPRTVTCGGSTTRSFSLTDEAAGEALSATFTGRFVSMILSTSRIIRDGVTSSTS